MGWVIILAVILNRAVTSFFLQAGTVGWGLAFVLFVSLLVGAMWFGARQLKQRQQLKQFVLKQQRLQNLLCLVDLGMLAFDGNEQLVFYNPKAQQILEKLPHNLDECSHLLGIAERVQSAKMSSGKLKLHSQFEVSGHIYAISLTEVGSEQIKQLPQISKDLQLELAESTFTLKPQTEEMTIVLLEDVTEASTLETQRQKFVANVSHELRTPLTTIKSYSETLLEWGLAEKTPIQIERDVDRIYRDAVRMEKLIDDLLLLSRLDGKAYYTQMRAQDVAQIIMLVCERFKERAEAKQQRLKVQLHTKLPAVFVDLTAMERVVSNLLSNAIKYSPEGGEINVFVGALLDEVYIKVRDTGIGMAPEHLSHIFERFYRVDTTGSRQLGGTGLGLSIVQELIELQGGEVSVQSEPSQFTEFSITLPDIYKTMRQTIFALEKQSKELSELQKAALPELEKIAQQHELSANWGQLSIAELDKYASVLDNLSSEERNNQFEQITKVIA